MTGFKLRISGSDLVWQLRHNHCHAVALFTFYGSGSTLQRLDIYASGKRKGTPVH